MRIILSCEHTREENPDMKAKVGALYRCVECHSPQIVVDRLE